ncbi:DMT family transporter [Myxococcota bacterium]|nr:DMT family transporter [Myxococcota bacterium]
MQLAGELAAIASAATWALANVVYVRLTAQQAPLVLNALKCTLALVLLALTAWILEGTPWPAGMERAVLVELAWSALIGITLGDTLYFAALERIGARRGVLLSALVPPASAIVAWVAFDEVMTLVKLAGMALTLGGVTLVMRERVGGESGAAARPGLARGLALGVGAVICQVAANIMTKDAGRELSALSISVVRLAAGTLGIYVWLVAARRVGEVVTPLKTPRTAGTIVLATLLGTYLGIWLYMAAIRYTDVGIAVTLSVTGPIFILPFARFVLGEPWTVRSIVGALVATGGVAVLLLS